MTITARAREIIQQTDTAIIQTVRFFRDGVQIKDAPVTYQPGPDQATAVTNLTAVVKAAVARAANDGSTVAVTPGTLLDLTNPAPAPPTQAELDRAAFADAYRTLGRMQRGRSIGVVDQASVDAQIAIVTAAWQSDYLDLL